MLPEITTFNGTEHQAFTLNGGKPGALLVHGFPGTPHEMRPLAEALHSRGWTTHALLLPGFGAEINSLLERAYDDWYSAVCTALTDLQRKHNPVLLVGNSMGGALAISAAAASQPDALVLIAPFYKLNHPLWETLPVLRRVVPSFKPFKLMKPDFRDPNFRQGVHSFMPGLDLDDPTTQAQLKDFAVPLKLFDHIRTAGKNAYRDAPKVKAPTLVLQGKQDSLVRPEMTRQLVARLGSNVTYLEVNGEHDLIFRERGSWQEVERTVLDFAAQQMVTI